MPWAFKMGSVTARREVGKEIALWRVALAFGFVFDVDDFIAATRH